MLPPTPTLYRHVCGSQLGKSHVTLVLEQDLHALVGESNQVSYEQLIPSSRRNEHWNTAGSGLCTIYSREKLLAGPPQPQGALDTVMGNSWYVLLVEYLKFQGNRLAPSLEACIGK